MTDLAHQNRASLLPDLLTRPLALPEFGLFGLVIIAAGTLYCQLYCVIAYTPMHHKLPMPLDQSVAWSLSTVGPWLCCFELSKRRSAWSQRALVRAMVIAGLFAATTIVSLILELGLDSMIGVETRAFSKQLAAQLPNAILTASVILLSPLRAVVKPPAKDASDALQAVLTLSPSILWIEAAGNYVELHMTNGISMHRVTMRDLEASLDRTTFRRIHRSAIVNLARVDARVDQGNSPAVRLTDGTIIKIGHRYARNFA